jgi:hypothetical protein
MAIGDSISAKIYDEKEINGLYRLFIVVGLSDLQVELAVLFSLEAQFQLYPS